MSWSTSYGFELALVFSFPINLNVLSRVLANSLRRRRSVSESDVTTQKHVEFLDQKYAEEREKSTDCDGSEFKSLDDETVEVENIKPNMIRNCVY